MRGRSKTKKDLVSKKKSTPKPRSKTRTEKEESSSRKTRKTRDRGFLDLEYRFKNNLEEWFAVLLTEGCNLCEDHKILQFELEEVFGDSVIYFLPIYIEKVGKKFIGVELFDGYVFVKKTETVDESCLVRHTEHLEGVLRGTKQQRPVNNRDINRLKTEIKHKLNKRIPKKGDKVSACEGTFKNMVGKVLSVNRKDRTARVEFRKKTRVVEAVLSVVNFEIVKGQ